MKVFLPLCLLVPLVAAVHAQPDDGRNAELTAAFREIALLEEQAARAEDDGRLEEAERALRRTVELIERMGGRQHPTALPKRGALAGFYERNGRFDDAERLLKQTIEIFETTTEDEQRSVRAFDLAETLAGFYERRKRFADAESALTWVGAPGNAPLGAAEPFLNDRFAILYAKWHRFADAVAYEQRIAGAVTDALAEAKAAGDRRVLTQTGPAAFAIRRLGVLAEIYDLEGRPDLAEATYARRVDLSDLHGDPGANFLEDLANFYSTRADYARAEAVLKRMLAARKGNASDATLRLAELYREAGRYHEAEQILRDRLGFYEQAARPPAWPIAQCRQRIAALYALQGRHADAEPLIERALETVPADRQLASDRAAWLKQHGDALKALGREAEAQSRHAEAERTLKRSIEESRNRQSAAIFDLASYYAEWGRHAEALPLAREALALSEKRHGPEHRMTATPLQTLADILEALGDHAQARDYARRALAIRERTRGPNHPDTKQSQEAVRRMEARPPEQKEQPSKAN